MIRQTFIIAITGASGSIYSIRLLKALMIKPVRLFVMVSDSGRQVMAHETDFKSGLFSDYLSEKGVVFHDKAELTEIAPSDSFAAIASGSFQHDGMVIAPCSMNTLSAISNGITNNLIHRAADVCLKEKRSLILLPSSVMIAGHTR